MDCLKIRFNFSRDPSFPSSDEPTLPYNKIPHYQTQTRSRLHSTGCPKLAYVKKYYDVMKDEIVMFPSVSKLILKNDLTIEAENYYYEEDDEFPPEYSKALKTVVRSAAKTEEETEIDEENDAYIEKLATDVDI